MQVVLTVTCVSHPREHPREISGSSALTPYLPLFPHCLVTKRKDVFLSQSLALEASIQGAHTAVFLPHMLGLEHGLT